MIVGRDEGLVIAAREDCPVLVDEEVRSLFSTEEVNPASGNEIKRFT